MQNSSKILLKTLSVLSLFFGKRERHRKPPKKKGFLIPTEPLKALERKGETLKNKGFLAGERNKEFQKSKERKDRECSEIRGNSGNSSTILTEMMETSLIC